MGATESAVRPDFDSMNLYEVLDVNENATKEEIKRSFRKRALEHHPDKNQHDVEDATKRFMRIQEAYETLIDENKRDRYDTLRSRPQPPSHAFNPQTSPDARGAWTTDDPSAPPQKSWYEWVFGPSPSSRSQRPRPSRWIYRDYVASQSGDYTRKPGIATQDILEFVPSLPDAFDLEVDDHSEHSFFTIVHNFFQCLAYDELKWGNKRDIPVFSCAHTVWSRQDWHGDPLYALLEGVYEVKGFYDFWTRFETSKTFEWVEIHDSVGLDEHSVRRANKAYQIATRNQYNDHIRNLARMLLELDPRYAIHLWREETKRQTTSGKGGKGNNNKKKHKKNRRRR